MSANLGKRGLVWTEILQKSEEKGSYSLHTDIIFGQLIQDYLKILFLTFIKEF